MLVRHPESRGVSAARNTGIEKASTPWLAFVDDDDLWAPGKVRSQLNALAAHPASQWSCTGSVNIDGQCRLAWSTEPPGDPDIGTVLLRQNVIPGGGSGVLASRELTMAVGGFDEALSNLADWDFYIRLGLRSRVAVVSRPLLGYYVHPQGMAHDVRRSELEYRYLEVKYGPERRRRQISPNHEAWLFYLSGMAYRSGDRWIGMRMNAELVGRYHRWRTLRPLALGLAPQWVRAAYVRGRSLALELAPQGVRAARVRAADVRLPSGWGAEAEAWLAPYASGWID
jgi:glycosyltransferase involved in cell wall biosynthesis